MEKKVKSRIKNSVAAFKSLLANEELEKENTKLYNLLSSAISSYNIVGRCALLLFNSGIQVIVEKDVDDFIIIISDKSLYQYEDTPTTRMSLDRIYYYLNYIGNVSLREA